MTKRPNQNGDVLLTLRARQALFVVEYLKDLNAKQAAIRAGYSAKTAQEQGSRLLSNVKVANAIAQANAERLEQVGYDASALLVELVEENHADLADLYDSGGKLKPIHDWPLVWRRGLVVGIDVEEIFEGNGAERQKVGEVRKLKLSDRVKRKELIGRHIAVQAFRERVEHDVSDPLKELMQEIGGRAIRPQPKTEEQSQSETLEAGDKAQQKSFGGRRT